MSPIANGRTKLTANALDRASTVCLTVGVLGPIVATLFGLGGTSVGARVILPLLAGSAFWLASATSLHWMARRTLGGLQ